MCFSPRGPPKLKVMRNNLETAREAPTHPFSAPSLPVVSFGTLTVKAADQHTFSENVAVDGFEHVGPSGVRPQVEFRIQGEELECVVVMRARGGSTRSHVAHASAQVLRLHRAVGQLSSGGHSFRESARRAWNVEYQPMQNVVRLLLQRDVRVVENQSETDRIRGNMGPVELG